MNDQFYYFGLRGSVYMTQGTTIMKYPSSLFKALVVSNSGNSPRDRIQIDRDPKHFGTILNLMRYKDVTYARHLSEKSEVSELLDDLRYYRLTELEEAVMKQVVWPSIDAPRATEIHFDYDYLIEEIREISRPIVVVDRLTIDWLSKVLTSESAGEDRPPIIGMDDFIRAFDWRYYDIKIFEGKLNGVFETVGDESSPRRQGVIHLCLYMPGSIEPKLVLDKVYSTAAYFYYYIQEFFAGSHMLIVHSEEYVKARSKLLKNLRFRTE